MRNDRSRRRGSGRGRRPIRIGRGMIAGIALVVIVAALIVSRSFGRSLALPSGAALTNPSGPAPVVAPLTRAP